MNPQTKKAKFMLVILLLMSSLWLAASILSAQTSSSYDLSWFTFAAGGQRASDNYTLQDVVGQAVGDFSTSASTAIQSGFVQADNAEVIFLPLVIR